MDYLAQGFIEAIRLLVSLDEETYSAVYTTLRVSTLSIFMSLMIGIPCGFGLGYFDFPARKPIRSVVDTLLALPTVVVGLFVYAFVTRCGPL
ncbi:MAG: ABC transporter permease, partial [Desulfomonilia bacterium]